MTRAVAMALMMAMPMPALAAGDTDLPLGLATLPFYFSFVLLFVLPVVGLGFFLQGFVRLRNAILLIAALAPLGFVAAALSYPDRITQLAGAAAVSLLILSPLFGLGWYLGILQMRRAARRSLA